MRCKKYSSLIWTLIFSISALAQCPVRDSLWQKINRLADAGIPVDSQLNVLLHFDNQLKECKTVPDSASALLYQRIGVMYYSKADYSASVKYTLQALHILNVPGKSAGKFSNQRLHCYYNLCFYYEALNQIGNKLEAMDSCISIGMTSRPVDSLVFYAIHDKMMYLINIGDYERCVQYGTLGQTFARDYGFTHSVIIKRILAWKIDALRLLNDFPQMAAELKDKIQEYEHFRNYDYIGTAYGQWADYYLGMKKYDSALLSYETSFRFEKRMKYNTGSASSLANMGVIYFENLEDLPRALNLYFQALYYSNSVISVNLFTNIANVYVRRNLFDSAFYYFQKAFDQIRPGMNERLLLNSRNNEYFNNLADYIMTLVLDKTDAYLEQYKITLRKGQLRQALISYRIADQLLDKIKQNQFELQSKLTWRNSVRRLYEHAIEACWLDHNVNEGFYFFEKSRAVLLDDQLKQDRLMQNQDASRQFQLKRSVNELEKQLDSLDPKSNNFSAIQSELIRKKEELDRLQLAIREKDPLDFARNPNERGLQISDLRAGFLKDYSGLVEVFNGDSSVFILTITGSDAKISKINKRVYDSLSKLLLSLISNPVTLNSQFPAFSSASRNLYQLIFPDQSLKPGRIIISPDGACFPFETLITSQGPDLHYMLYDYSISYTYSARFLMSPFANVSNKSAGDFMGVAPVRYAPYQNLSSLPGSDQSLQEITKHFKNEYTQTNGSALKSNFLASFSDYKIVQLYSHAGYNSTAREPVIYFADSSLYLSELISKTIPATRLVVLSACETALGQDYKGEGVFSFSREFATLGIPASVSNLWSVDNASTYKVTELFYEYIAEGLPTDLALQKAKLEFIKNAPLEKSLPFYWAAPILTGKAEIIKMKSSLTARYVIGIIGLLGIFSYAAFKFIKGRHNRV